GAWSPTSISFRQNTEFFRTPSAWAMSSAKSKAPSDFFRSRIHRQYPRCHVGAHPATHRRQGVALCHGQKLSGFVSTAMKACLVRRIRSPWPSFFGAGSRNITRIEHITYRVTNHVDGKHRQCKGKAGCQCHPWCRQNRADAFTNDIAPARLGRLNAQPKKAERCFVPDRTGHTQRRHDYQGSDNVRKNMLHDNPAVAPTKRPGGSDIIQFAQLHGRTPCKPDK